MSEREHAPSGEEINNNFVLAMRKLGVETDVDLNLTELRHALEQNNELDEDDPAKLNEEEARAIETQLSAGETDQDQPLGSKTDNPDTLARLQAMERGFLQHAASPAFVEEAGTGRRRAIAVTRVRGGTRPDAQRMPLAVEDFEPPTLPDPSMIAMMRARKRGGKR